MSTTFLLVAQILAAPTDCIREGGEMLCTEPYPGPWSYGYCVPTLLAPAVGREGYCAGQVPNAGSSEGGLISVMTCFAEFMLCPGTVNLNFGSWSGPGAVETGFDFLCGTYRTREQNGYQVANYQVLHPTGMSGCPPPPQGSGASCGCPGVMYPTGVLIASRARSLVCPPNWFTGSRPNGDLRCYQCPPNSTFNGVGCVCNAPLVKDPITKQCVTGCFTSADCNQADVCNPEICVGATGTTVGQCLRRPKDCKEMPDKVCTIDTCNAQKNVCEHVFDKSACVCNTPPLPDVSAGFQKEWGAVLPCPLVGGSVGTQFSLSASLTSRPATCRNGCEAKFSGEAKGEIAVLMCKNSRNAAFSGKYERKDTSCLDCDESTCEQTCSGSSCYDSNASLSGTLGGSTFIGISQGRSIGPFNIGFRCGGTLEGSGGPSYRYDSKGGSASCMSCGTQCTKHGLSTTVSGGASQLGCELYGQDTRGGASGSGAQAGAFAKVTLTGLAEEQLGACGNKTCAFIRADAEYGGRIRLNLQLGWRVVAVECVMKANGCAEANSCGSCSCKDCADHETEFSCTVTGGEKHD